MAVAFYLFQTWCDATFTKLSKLQDKVMHKSTDIKREVQYVNVSFYGLFLGTCMCSYIVRYGACSYVQHTNIPPVKDTPDPQHNI